MKKKSVHMDNISAVKPIDPFKNFVHGRLDKESKYFFTGNMQYPFNVESLGVTYPDPEYFIARQVSDYFIAEYVFSGSGELEVNGKKFTVGAGDVYILPPESKHRYNADRQNPFQKIWCNFYSDSFEQVLHSYMLDTVFVFHAPECKEDFFELFSMAQLGNTINDDAWTTVAHIMFNILNKLAIKYYKPADMSIAARAKELLDNALFSSITVEEISKQLFISKVTLTREFRNMYGIAPYQYLINKKLSQAKFYLHTSDLTVKEISNKLNFSDEHYFSFLFKSKTGLSPTEFKRIFS